jgi:hypothetical protein
MKDEKNVAAYLLHVDEIVNTIRGLSEIVAEPMIVQKVLRSLLFRFDAKFSSIKEMKDLDQLTMDELHDILTSYEMRNEKEKPSKREASFKTSKKMKNKEHKSSDCSNYESHAEEENFLKKFKEGSSKYEGKFPFKFFNCGKVGHFVSKCPYVKNESSDNEEDYNVKSKQHQHKNSHKQSKHENKEKYYKKKKSLYSKGVNDSSEERSFDSDREETLFMKIEIKIDEDMEMIDSEEEENFEIDEEIDLEEELICSLR